MFCVYGGNTRLYPHDESEDSFKGSLLNASCEGGVALNLLIENRVLLNSLLYSHYMEENGLNLKSWKGDPILMKLAAWEEPL